MTDLPSDCVQDTKLYIGKCLEKGILFRRITALTLEAYRDADYVGSTVDGRSTMCYCMFLGINLATWRSKKQIVVARSNAEPEF